MDHKTNYHNCRGDRTPQHTINFHHKVCLECRTTRGCFLSDKWQHFAASSGSQIFHPCFFPLWVAYETPIKSIEIIKIQIGDAAADTHEITRTFQHAGNPRRCWCDVCFRTDIADVSIYCKISNYQHSLTFNFRLGCVFYLHQAGGPLRFTICFLIPNRTVKVACFGKLSNPLHLW